MKHLSFFFFACSIAFAACNAQSQFKPIEKMLDTVQPDSIKSHITYLADDRLLGRKPGTPGYQMAVDYVIKKYKEIGLSPAGDGGGYLQKVVLRNARLSPQESFAKVSTDTGYYDLQSKDFFFFPSFLSIPDSIPKIREKI